MRNKIFFAAMMFGTLPMAAQETYENANIATQDLNGTARYVGMGGAMDALGADISTIGTNPAGIGLFRKSQVNASFGFVSQGDVSNSSFVNKTNMSFDQIGFVYSTRTNSRSFLNLAFNYHKSRNFDQILEASGRLQNASQNKLSYVKGYNGLFKLDIDPNTGRLTSNDRTYSMVDYLYYNSLLKPDENGNIYAQEYDRYDMNRSSNGYIGEYDFNISGNINNRVYLGFTFGIHDVHYKNYVSYNEYADNDGKMTALRNEQKITGTGYDFKAGVIIRPVEESPFRFGFSVASPIFYDLKSNNETACASTAGPGLYPTDRNDMVSLFETHEFRMNTPWKFGVSLGHTIDNMLAIGVGYEYADYATIDNRYKDGGYEDWYGDWHETSSSDIVMNADTKANLKGVHTFKVGAELKADPNMAIRLGYNYVSAAYNTDAYRDQSLDTDGVYYSSTTDYTNWKDTHRITCGFGYQIGKFNVDLAYQFSSTNGEHYPFMSYYAGANEPAENDNIADMTKVSNKRHQMLLTLGYRF